MDSDLPSAVVLLTSIINALSIIVLTFITAWYARSTARLLDETRKARDAAERQAVAAEETIAVLQRQIETQASLSKTIVASAIQSAHRNIEWWQNANLFNLAAQHAIPETIELLPANAQAAVEHGRGISTEGSVELSSCFDHMRRAKMLIKVLKSPPWGHPPSSNDRSGKC